MIYWIEIQVVFYLFTVCLHFGHTIYWILLQCRLFYLHHLLYTLRNDPKFSDRYAWAKSADPDQTAPRGGAVWSGSIYSQSVCTLVTRSTESCCNANCFIFITCCTYCHDPKFSDRYAWANSADPDQTAPRGGAVWSGSTLFAIPSASFGHITLW